MSARYPDAAAPTAAKEPAPAKPNDTPPKAAADKTVTNALAKPDNAVSPLPPKVPAGVPLKPDTTPTGSIRPRAAVPKAKTR
jgi:hypothetical protein